MSTDHPNNHGSLIRVCKIVQPFEEGANKTVIIVAVKGNCMNVKTFVYLLFVAGMDVCALSIQSIFSRGGEPISRSMLALG